MKKTKLTFRKRVIGLMSGTSMDGLDIALCQFESENQIDWKGSIVCADAADYSDQWVARLQNLHLQNAEVFAKTNVYYGHLLGEQVTRFLEKNKLSKDDVDLVSSHGQTIFHNPSKSYTVQIGLGANIAQQTDLPVVCDLRTSDMAYGGQGAPIVPLGEEKLFPDHNLFLNLGGISNIQIHTDPIIGFDVCMANIVMDHLARSLGFSYDSEGKLARSGQVQPELLKKLSSWDFYKKTPPKSLDAEAVLQRTLPLIQEADCSVVDALATLVEHISIQINEALIQQNVSPNETLFITGGGALNTYLIERIDSHIQQQVFVPNRKIVLFKEAYIIAFLGLMRWLRQVNVLRSVTGAKKDTINGAVYLP